MVAPGDGLLVTLITKRVLTVRDVQNRVNAKFVIKNKPQGFFKCSQMIGAVCNTKVWLPCMLCDTKTIR